jgi:transposase
VDEIGSQDSWFEPVCARGGWYEGYLLVSAQYRRLAARRGKKKAIVDVEHTILVMAYHLIQRKEPYRELGENYFDNRRPEATAKRLVIRLEQLGYAVSLQQAPALASA